MIDEQTLNNLIIRICNQDLRAQADLFELSYKYFYQVAVSILRNKQDAEDVVGIFFENIYVIADRCAKSNNKLSYLRASIVNISKNLIRENQKYAVNDIENIGSCDYDSRIDFDSDFMKLLDSKLTEQEKIVVINMIYYDYTYREMAKAIGASVGKVQRIKYSALNKIKKANLV